MTKPTRKPPRPDRRSKRRSPGSFRGVEIQTRRRPPDGHAEGPPPLAFLWKTASLNARIPHAASGGLSSGLCLSAILSWRFLSCGDTLETRIDLTIKQATQAIYENGVFRPLGKVDLAENSRVDLSFQQTEENDGPKRKLPLELQELIGSISPEDCDIMEKAIEEAFEQIDLDAWK